MPLHNGDQSDQSAAIDMSSTDAIRSITRSKKQVKLSYNGSTWQYDLHDGIGIRAIPGVPATKNYYDPPFSVRSINMCDASEGIRNIHYDSAGDGVSYKENTDAVRDRYSKGIIETFATNILIPLHVTRVYLDSFTTATEIHLHG